MRVAFLGDRLGLATGGNLYVARVAAELARLGADVSLITLNPPQDIAWDPAVRVISQTVDFTFGRSPKKGKRLSFLQSKFAAVGELKKLVRESYDILYSVGGPSNIVNHLCRLSPFHPRASVAAVFHLFRQVSLPRFLLTGETYRKPFQTWYHSRGDHLAKGFEGTVTVSEYWRSKLIARGFMSDRVRVIPVGADTRDWTVPATPAAQKALGLEDRLVIYTSPLRLQKGILQVLQAAATLVGRFPRLLVLSTGVSDDRTQERVQHFLQTHRFQDHFRYDGLVPRERLPLYQGAAQVVVLASQEEEGWGIFLLEGMLSGKPVVCTPLGAMPELVGGRGIVLKENNAPALSQALEQLLSSPELRERLGRSGRDFAAGFSYEATARAHKLFFEQLLAGSPNKPSHKN